MMQGGLRRLGVQARHTVLRGGSGGDGGLDTMGTAKAAMNSSSRRRRPHAMGVGSNAESLQIDPNVIVGVLVLMVLTTLLVVVYFRSLLRHAPNKGKPRARGGGGGFFGGGNASSRTQYGAGYAKVNPRDSYDEEDEQGNTFEIAEMPHRGTIVYYG